jgi:hypothetical protein
LAQGFELLRQMLPLVLFEMEGVLVALGVGEEVLDVGADGGIDGLQARAGGRLRSLRLGWGWRGRRR